MAAPADFHTRLARLGLAARLRFALSVVVIPVALAALLALAMHVAAMSAWDDVANRDVRVLELAGQCVPLARGAANGARGPGQAAAPVFPALRTLMREVVALTDDTQVRVAAQALSLATYDAEAGKPLAAPLAALLDKLSWAASRAVARSQSKAGTLANVALAVLLLAPALALAGGLLVARSITRGIDGTLRDCIAFAGEIASANFRHGGAHARPGARAKHMAASSDSASEFDVLVRSMNRIAEETLTAAEREVEQVARLERVERSWALLSACSQSLVKASSEAALTDAICHHLVELGGYRIAWVGYAWQDDACSVVPVSHAGTDRAYIDALHLSWGPDVHKQGGFGTAISQRRPLVCRNMQADPLFTSWKAVAPPHGVEACIALPLIDEHGAFAVLSVYSEDSKALSDDEVKLLQDLSDDLAFGITSRREHEKREQVEEELAHHVNYDGLTGLANLPTLRGQLVQHAAAARDAQRKVAALHVNIDRFRDVNEKLGRDAGDRLLLHVAERLRKACGHHALLARAGADEFIAVLAGIGGSGTAAEAATRMVAALGEVLSPEALGVSDSGDTEWRPVASVGVSLYPDDSGDMDALLRHAELAMQDAKRQGGNGWRFYAKEMNARMAARHVMESELAGALERGEMVMHYQPQCSLVTGAITGVEALMRWHHPTRGVVAPGEFLRVAEETGLMQPFGAWALDTACGQSRAWREAGLHVPPVSLNLSARQFHQAGLADMVKAALQRHHLPEKTLELEFTESAVMRDPESAAHILRQLKEIGVRIALDDFGTGYTSLGYLKRFPVDHLKIDPSFVRDMVSAPDDAAICNAVIALAHSLHLGVIAKGVETEEQMNYLRRRHCDAMQGFLFSRAVSADGLADLLASGRKLSLFDHGEPSRTVLLLDDEPNVVRALNRALRQDGYKILAATSAADALKLLANNPVQVVLSDQRMPEMAGTEFMRRVKDLYPGTVRIILSGYADLESVIEAINRGTIYRFFAKPWNDDELRACIQEAFRYHTSGQA